jgi:hypothetical protein
MSQAGRATLGPELSATEGLGDADAESHAAGAVGEGQHDAADVRAEPERARQVQVAAGEPRLAGGDVDEVGDQRGSPPPLPTRLLAAPRRSSFPS